MIDLHTHILPGIDDGSRSTEMTKEMLLAAEKQGVDQIVATPHFYANRMSMDHFLEKREEARARTEHLFGTVTLRTGAEVYYFRGMGEAAQLPRLCIEDTRSILIELPFAQWEDSVYRDLRAITERQRLTVILAHIERYPDYQKDPTTWQRIFAELPVIPQLNAGSFLGRGGLFGRDKKRRYCLAFLERHPGTVLGSDCHNTTTRRPNLADGRKVIDQMLGKEALRQMDDTAEAVLTTGGTTGK